MSHGIQIPDIVDGPAITIDQIEAAMVGGPPMVSHVVNHFPPGLYVRECHFAAGTLGTSMIHKVEHPFILARGVVEVMSEAEGSVTYRAPHVGITKPGTRRVLHALEDTVWITIHPNPDDCQDVETIVRRVTDEPENPLLPEGAGNQWRLNNSTPVLPP
jgi:hypothetical protein